MADHSGNQWSSGSTQQFGLLIAYVLPGFVALWGLSYQSPLLRQWLTSPQASVDFPTIGGFLYVALASIALGMTLSAVRWLAIDRINEYTGLARPQWDDTKLQQNLGAYNLLRDIHYRYYQFHANGLLALAVVLAARPRGPEVSADVPIDVLDAVLLVLVGVFFVTARDNLAKYHHRVTILLDHLPERSPPMSNGGHKPKPNPSSPEKSGKLPKPQQTHEIPRPADVEDEAGRGVGKQKKADNPDV